MPQSPWDPSAKIRRMSQETKAARPLRVVFWSSTEFGLPTLTSLLSGDRCELPLVVTRAPAPKGRKKLLEPTPIAKYVREEHPAVELAEPEKLAYNEELKARIRAIEPDAYILASFGMILPSSYLKLTEHPLCLHPSPLPRLRGPSPIRQALMEGWEKTAVCVMKMVREADCGPVMLCREQAIDPEDNFGTLREKLAVLAAECANDALRRISDGTVRYEPQSDDDVSCTGMLEPADTHIDFSWEAARLVNLIRAMAPEPGAVCQDADGSRLKILRASLGTRKASDAAPGTVISVSKRSFEIVAGDGGTVVVHEVQPEGRRAMEVCDYLAGHRMEAGEKLAKME